MMKRNLLIILSAVSLVLTGCFDSLNPSNKSQTVASSTSAIDSTTFSGATSAVNKVTGVLVSWAAVTDTSLVKAYRIYRVAGTKKTLLSSVAPSITSYIDGTVVWGTIYTYQVNAVDQNDIEDSNTKTVKSLSWAGISSVSATSRTSLSVNFDNVASVVDEIRIYGQYGVGGTKTLLASGSGSDTSISITGLRKGYPYIITAQAYVSSLGKEDGNDVTFSASTLTLGYDYDGDSVPQWGNVMQIRAFGDAPGAPAHANTPDKSPTSRVVELVFNAFSSAGSSAKYVVTRTLNGNLLDSSVSANCTSTTETSCRVCNNVQSQNDVVTCRDTTIAASPVKYRYSLSLVQEDSSTGDTWIEALPSDETSLESFSVLVAVPPNNMVLVQRDAANYEMCLQLGKTPDPVNHNRCIYSGVGGQPYSAGNNKPALNLSTGYYDFGYNLFADRWQMACNWTRSANGGKCGANHSSGDCIGYGSGATAPDTTVGQVGDVFFQLGSGGYSSCFIATAADSSGNITWTTPFAAFSTDSASTYYKKMFTSDPGYIDSSGNYDTTQPGRRGKVSVHMNAIVANGICASQSDSSYGQKRLPRLREFAVFAAPSLLTGELYPFANYTIAYNYMQGLLAHSSSFACDSSNNTADSLPTTFSPLGSGSYKNMLKYIDSSSVSYGNRTYMIGAPETVDCQTRYGVQDFVSRKWVSDVANYNATTNKLTGAASPFDNGNKDLLADLNGGQTGFVWDGSKFTSGTLASASQTGLVPTLAMPLTASSFSSDYITKNAVAQPYGMSYVMPSTAATSELKYMGVSFRWTVRADFTSSSYGNSTSETHCVLPAD